MIDSIENFKIHALDFTNKILLEINALALGGEFSLIDHICYRVETPQRYEHWKKLLLNQGVLLSEAVINGRPIAAIKLNIPLVVNHQYSIDIIELPMPKPNKFYQEGFEHIEAVSKTSLEDIIKKFPTVDFKTSNMNAAVNRDISINLNTGVFKLHESSLEDVILEEQKI